MRTTSRSAVRLLVAVAVVLIAATVLLLRAPLGAVMWKAFAPLLSARNALSQGEVADLKAQIASTSAALAQYELISAENQELRAELGRKGSAQAVLAGVLQHPPGTPYDTLSLDAGSAQGVSVGQKVSASGIVIGIIDSVTSGSSRATLFSSPGQSYQAYIVGKNGQLSISFEGQGGGSMRGQLPAGSAVSVGDSIVLPGVAGEMSAKVSAVEAPQGESFMTVYSRVPFNVFDLRYVYIEL